MNIRTVILGVFIACVSLPRAGLGASLLEIVQVGSGLQATVEVRGDDAMTFLHRKKDATTWQIDIAMFSPGNLPASIPLSIPAATGIAVEKRKVGKIEATRLALTVRPNVDVTVIPSSDRRTLTLSFSSAPASTDSEKLLDDLDDRPSGKDSPNGVEHQSPTGGAISPAREGAAEAVPAPLVVEPAIAGTPVVAENGSGAVKHAAPPSDLDRELKDLEEKMEEQSVPKPLPLPVEPKRGTTDPPPPVVTGTVPDIQSGALTPDELAVTPPAPAEKPVAAPLSVPSPRVEAIEPSKPSVTLSGSSFEIAAPGVASVRPFTLFQPTRVVVDLFGVSEDLSASLPSTGFPPSVRGIRSSRYPDKIRIVFDMKGDDLPEYAVARSGSVVRITFR